MTRTLYPYPRLPEPVIRITVDGRDQAGDERKVDLRDAPHNAREAVEFGVEVELRDVDTLVPPATDIMAAVVVMGGRTDMRQSKVLEPGSRDGLRLSGLIELDPRNYRGEAELKVVVSGTVDSLENRILAESDPWVVVLDDLPTSLVRNGLPIRWVDFEKHERLQEFPGEPFYVDLTGEFPEVLLNNNPRLIELRQVLPREGKPGGPLGAAYETVRTGIARAVWLTLVKDAVDGIIVEEDNEPRLPNIQWQVEVLQSVLPRALNEGLEDAVRTVGYARKNPDELRDLEARMLMVIDRDLVRGGTAIRRAVQTLTALTAEAE
jgi:hypothetical protein